MGGSVQTLGSNGFGIGNLRLQNEALLAKWLWRFSWESGTRVIVSKYGPFEWVSGWDFKDTSIKSWEVISYGFLFFPSLCII